MDVQCSMFDTFFIFHFSLFLAQGAQNVQKPSQKVEQLSKPHVFSLQVEDRVPELPTRAGQPCRLEVRSPSWGPTPRTAYRGRDNHVCISWKHVPQIEDRLLELSIEGGTTMFAVLGSAVPKVEDRLPELPTEGRTTLSASLGSVSLKPRAGSQNCLSRAGQTISTVLEVRSTS